MALAHPPQSKPDSVLVAAARLQAALDRRAGHDKKGRSARRPTQCLSLPRRPGPTAGPPRAYKTGQRACGQHSQGDGSGVAAWSLFLGRAAGKGGLGCLLRFRAVLAYYRKLRPVGFKDDSESFVSGEADLAGVVLSFSRRWRSSGRSVSCFAFFMRRIIAHHGPWLSRAAGHSRAYGVPLRRDCLAR